MGLNVVAEPAPTTIVQQPATAPSPPAINELLQVKVGNIARQGNECKVELVSWEKVEEGRANFKKKDGEDPPYAERPTREHITIFLALLTHLASIYVDFAIFVPRGDRALQDRLFDAMLISGAGILTKVRLHGPPSNVEWLACYKRFWTLCLMYDVIDNGLLKNICRENPPVHRGFSRLLGA